MPKASDNAAFGIFNSITSALLFFAIHQRFRTCANRLMPTGSHPSAFYVVPFLLLKSY
jgi:hypothetical protein